MIIKEKLLFAGAAAHRERKKGLCAYWRENKFSAAAAFEKHFFAGAFFSINFSVFLGNSF